MVELLVTGAESALDDDGAEESVGEAVVLEVEEVSEVAGGVVGAEESEELCVGGVVLPELTSAGVGLFVDPLVPEGTLVVCEPPV